MDNLTKPKVELLVTDLDNTVWDWFDAWHKSFTALLTGLHKETGLPLDELERAIRPIHQARFTTEYSWLIDELDLLTPFVGRAKTSGSDLTRQSIVKILQESVPREHILVYLRRCTY